MSYQPEELHRLHADHFTHVVDCCIEHQPMAQHIEDSLAQMNVSWHWVPTNDDYNTKLAPGSWLYTAIPTVNVLVHHPRSRVLIHCAQGYNRGPSLAYAALRCLGQTPTEAITNIKTRRHVGLSYGLEAEIVFQRLQEEGKI